MNDEKVAQGLGWFSIGLGLYELVEPDRLSESLGLKDKAGLVRFYGARELTAGAGIFAQEPDRAFWLWARVAGDALDLATLSTGLTPDNPKRENATTAFAMVVGITLLDIWCAQSLSQRGR
ncbi:MAG: hypothetical protein JO316_09615 [Abitibacteriaceae bacterium]|nr:hypothetical protein [Abditibacteriaceae bacterium]